MPHILIVLASVREGRRGEHIARWVTDQARKRADFTFELVDVGELALPFYARFEEPSEAGFEPQGQAIEWSKKVQSADGFIFITPEYNHGYPAPLKNALDHLSREWNKKPAAFVSYGGIAGGARAVEQLRQVVIDLDMVPLVSAVHITRIKLVLEKGSFEEHERALLKLFDQLLWWANILKEARAKS